MDESLNKIKINNNLNFNQSDIAALSIDGGMFSEKDIYISNGITIGNTNNFLYEGTIKFTDSVFYGYTGTEWEVIFNEVETTDQIIVSDIVTSDLTSTNIYVDNIYATDITSNNFTVATLTVVSDLINVNKEESFQILYASDITTSDLTATNIYGTDVIATYIYSSSILLDNLDTFTLTTGSLTDVDTINTNSILITTDLIGDVEINSLICSDLTVSDLYAHSTICTDLTTNILSGTTIIADTIEVSGALYVSDIVGISDIIVDDVFIRQLDIDYDQVNFNNIDVKDITVSDLTVNDFVATTIGSTDTPITTAYAVTINNITTNVEGISFFRINANDVYANNLSSSLVTDVETADINNLTITTSINDFNYFDKISASDIVTSDLVAYNLYASQIGLVENPVSEIYISSDIGDGFNYTSDIFVNGINFGGSSGNTITCNTLSVSTITNLDSLETNNMIVNTLLTYYSNIDASSLGANVVTSSDTTAYNLYSTNITNEESLTVNNGTITSDCICENVTVYNTFSIGSGPAQIATINGYNPLYVTRTWLVCNPDLGVLLASGNVSSISVSSGTILTINFTEALPNTNYKIFVKLGYNSGVRRQLLPAVLSYSTTSCQIRQNTSGFSYFNRMYVEILL